MSKFFDYMVTKARRRTASQSILENLFEAQKLQNRQVDRGVESQASFIRAKGRIELYTVSTIDLDRALIIFPYYPKLNDSFRNGGDFEGGLVLRILLKE